MTVLTHKGTTQSLLGDYNFCVMIDSVHHSYCRILDRCQDVGDNNCFYLLLTCCSMYVC